MVWVVLIAAVAVVYVVIYSLCWMAGECDSEDEAD